MTYLLDANVFMDAANRHYPFEVVPAFWDWLNNAHQAGKVLVPEKVYDEVVAGAGDLTAWFKAQPKSWRLRPGAADQPSLAALSAWVYSETRFTAGARSDFLSKADYFLVAQAATLGYTVVTHETSDLNSKKIVKIPDACVAVGVPYMNTFKMLQVEKAKFGLMP